MLHPLAATVTVTTDYTTLVEDNPGGNYDTVTLQVTSAAGSATLSDFRLSVKPHAGAEYEPFLGGADWASATENMLFCTTTVPNTLAAEGQATVKVNVRGWYAIKFEAKVASNTAAITVKGQCV